MKTKTWTLILIIFLVAGFKTVNALSFPDVSDTNPHNKAIDYLSDIGILSGYSDQTFKPYRLVNRAEFLKIVLEASQIQTNETTPTNFTDINNNAWYAKYVRTAYHEGWIEGYPDGTFKPENTINQVEALKIIGEVQNWQTATSFERPFSDVPFTAWYAPFVTYAKDKNFLFTRTS
ncbi:hypothetical protein GF340_02355, partial [Candidatus Peregrinibacteria bacterium]|nr:hypothetical protein [Candidatus Peregrinibacteria bacterium]